MAINDNIGRNLDKNFENFNFLPQKLELEDFDFAVRDLIKDLNISVEIETGNVKIVPIIFLTQELWAERKMNWKNMRSEAGQEITRPFMTLVRTDVKKGSSPLKYSVPKKKKFTFTKVPVFDGTMKGYNLYKIPQPTYVDIVYNLSFVTHYMQDVNLFYETVMREGFSDGQAYMKINGYDISSRIADPSENNSVDEITAERIYQISFPVTVYGKLVDPTKFEKVNAVKKVSIKISEL